jgi:hypothetical protein
LLRGGILLGGFAAHREGRDGEAGDRQQCVFHTNDFHFLVPILINSGTVRSGLAVCYQVFTPVAAV